MATRPHQSRLGNGIASVAEAAEELHVSPDWLRRQLHRYDGRLPFTVGGNHVELVAVRLRGKKAPWRISRASLDRLLDAQ